MQRDGLGHWWASLGGPPTRRQQLEGLAEADVAIVGAGYTGLWSAYYLKRAQPELEVAVLEREHAGFGASGRNGGWVAGSLSGPARAYERARPPGAYTALRQALIATVDEVGAVLDREQIDAGFAKRGALTVAVGEAQAARLRAEFVRSGEREEAGTGERLLGARELEGRMRVHGACAASFSPHVARVHPAKLLVGLAASVERLGVRIYEGTPVLAITAHEARTPAGSVRARWIVRATEGYTAQLPGLRRALVPLNSSMLITEPLAAELWEQIGWEGGEVLADAAHVFAYLQRTEDGSIAIGGRGVPYRFGSHIDRLQETAPQTVAGLRARLTALFPATAGVALEQAWSGTLGLARDWCASVTADPARGLAWAGGYAGEGLAASNLAARTLRALILEEDGPLAELAWVGHRARAWEPEPLRWSAIRGVYSLYRLADRIERRTRRPSRLAHALDLASGRA